MSRTAILYERPLVTASMSALLELTMSLRSYREALVLIGGWVPFILLRDHRLAGNDFEHIGSIDIDLVVDPDRISTHEYATIVEIITDRGWSHSEGSLFSFSKQVPASVGAPRHEVRVDFLTPEPGEPAGRHRHRKVQPDLMARRARGASLALSHNCMITVDGQLPDGGHASTSVLMADVVGCVGMKGLALGSRYSEKDAYDLYAVVEYFGQGPQEVAAMVRPFLEEPLMAESIGHIRGMFGDERAAGPSWVANFLTEARDESHRRLAVRAFMVVSRFLEGLEEH